MRTLLALLLAAAAATTRAEDAVFRGQPPAVHAAPTAEELLRDVLARLPREPLVLNGDITLRKRHGVVLRELKFEMTLNWAAVPSTARYRIFDTLGKELEAMTLVRPSEGVAQVLYTRGGEAVEAPPSGASIQGTDVTWEDLTLSFLWWSGGIVLRRESLRGRDCYVVDVPAPRDARGAYARVLLWIDAEMRVLLQAEGHDDSGRAARTLWVRSVKKVNQRWMVKDLEVQQNPTRRTKLTVREVIASGKRLDEEPATDAVGEEAGRGEEVIAP